jgi:hypothetical protein
MNGIGDISLQAQKVDRIRSYGHHLQKKTKPAPTNSNTKHNHSSLIHSYERIED